MTLTHLLVLLIVGALAGLIGERLVSRGMPGGLIGAIVAGLVGAWLMVGAVIGRNSRAVGDYRRGDRRAPLQPGGRRKRFRAELAPLLTTERAISRPGRCGVRVFH